MRATSPVDCRAVSTAFIALLFVGLTSACGSSSSSSARVVPTGTPSGVSTADINKAVKWCHAAAGRRPEYGSLGLATPTQLSSLRRTAEEAGVTVSEWADKGPEYRLASCTFVNLSSITGNPSTPITADPSKPQIPDRTIVYTDGRTDLIATWISTTDAQEIVPS
jgi:hypothetical protein